MGSNDYHAPVLKNPARYLTRDHAKVVGAPVGLPTEELREGMTSGAGSTSTMPARA